MASPVLLMPTAGAAVDTDTTAFREAVTVAGIEEHLDAFQEIANANDGNRASGTSGYDASGEYVKKKLEEAGYEVVVQRFEFPFFEEVTPSTFAQAAPGGRVYGEDDFLVMEYSGSGSVTGATVQGVELTLPPAAEENSSTSGCEPSDFTGFTAGAVALVQRGTCPFATKAENAQDAGASAVIIFNEGQEGRTDVLNGTLGGPGVTIPVLGTSFAVGEELAAGDVAVSIATSTRSGIRNTQNYIAQRATGRTDRVVLVGAHLDSVPEGPGINDNGSGSATVLEIAEQLASIDTRNAVRFAFWGAEESGLLGAEYYVSQLTAREKKDIALNLNFDMLGSRNYERFVYDGDGSATGTSGPNGSGTIEQVFLDHFASQDLEAVPTEFDGRSDYGPFIAAGIPAGGLFSGAEGTGENGEAYDPCYHKACDDRSNINPQALDELGDAAAHATLVFAQTTSAVNGTGKASGNAKGAGDHLGHALQR